MLRKVIHVWGGRYNSYQLYLLQILYHVFQATGKYLKRKHVIHRARHCINDKVTVVISTPLEATNLLIRHLCLTWLSSLTICLLCKLYTLFLPAVGSSSFTSMYTSPVYPATGTVCADKNTHITQIVFQENKYSVYTIPNTLAAWKNKEMMQIVCGQAYRWLYIRMCTLSLICHAIHFTKQD